MKKRCILIGAGDLTVGTVNGYNPETDFVIAVDGGLMYCPYLNMEPDLILGDFDSVDEKLASAIEQIEAAAPEKVLRLNPVKDDTDMLYAIKWALREGFRDFRIYGATGGRMDHALANIQCLLYLKHHDAEGFLMDGTGMTFVICSDESKSFKQGMEGYLSLLSLENTSVVSIKGMKYELSKAPVTNDFPLGISNEFLEDRAGEITVHSGSVVVIISWPE